MTPEREAELFVKIDMLIDLCRSIQADHRNLADKFARMEGRVEDMPTARDFGRLEGRVAEMSERLPTMIGYAPPGRPAA